MTGRSEGANRLLTQASLRARVSSEVREGVAFMTLGSSPLLLRNRRNEPQIGFLLSTAKSRTLRIYMIEYDAATVSASAASNPPSITYDTERGSERRCW